MRRSVGAGEGAGRAAASVQELAPCGPLPGAAPLDASLSCSANDPEALSSPTARKLHQRNASTALVQALPRRLARLRIVAAAAAALLVLLALLGRWSAVLPAHDALPGANELGASPAAFMPAVAADLGLRRARGSSAEAAKGPGRPLLVEFTAPALYLPLSQALDLHLPEQPAELALQNALPQGGMGPPEAVAFGGRPTLEQVLTERQRQQQRQQEGSRQGMRTSFGLGSETPSTVVPAATVGSSPEGGSSTADLANQIQSELQQREEAVRRARDEPQGEGEGAAAGAGLRQDSYEEAVAEALRRANERGVTSKGRDEVWAGSVDAAEGEARVLVAVTSACCTEAALERRAAIRDTWGRDIREHHPSLHVRFILSQPASPALVAAWLPRLQEEIARHNDSVVVRGPDTYMDLPNKTLRALRYALAHPAGFSHILKTDDDCYLRPALLLDSLSAPTAAQPAAASLPGLRRALREQTASSGAPLHSDGIMLYNASRLVSAAGAAAGRMFLDDAAGEALSLAQLAGEAADAAAEMRQRAGAGQQAERQNAGRALTQEGVAGSRLRMSGVYLGCLENKGGYFPIRDASSKWFVSPDELPDAAVPFARKYLAGWGYVLSRDMADHAVRKANLFQLRPDLAPAWFRPMHWEDVLVSFLLLDAVEEPQDHAGFRAAWRACPSTTLLKHLDVDAPRLMRGLHEQDASGLWAAKPVQCSTGDFLPGDYASWRRWRDGLPSVAHI